MSNQKARDLSVAHQQDVFATLQGVSGLGWVMSKGGLLDAIEKGRAADEDAPKAISYQERSKSVEALINQYPLVKAGPLGQEFEQLRRVLAEAAEDARTNKLGAGETGCRNPVLDAKGEWLSAWNPLNKGGSCSFYNKEKQLYANFLRMGQIESKILEEASKLKDGGVKMSPEVQAAIEAATSGGKGTGDKPINWWLWGGVGAGVLALGGLLWWKASKVGKPAPVQGLGRVRTGRKFRSKRRSR